MGKVTPDRKKELFAAQESHSLSLLYVGKNKLKMIVFQHFWFPLLAFVIASLLVNGGGKALGSPIPQDTKEVGSVQHHAISANQKEDKQALQKAYQQEAQQADEQSYQHADADVDANADAVN